MFKKYRMKYIIDNLKYNARKNKPNPKAGLSLSQAKAH